MSQSPRFQPNLPAYPHIPRALVAISQPGSEEFQILPGATATVSAFDRSFHFGDSLYEVARTYQGILFAFSDHMARLDRSAQLALFDDMPAPSLIGQMVSATCAAYLKQYGNTELYVRTTVSRGVGDVQIDRRSAGAPYVVVIVKDLYRAGRNPDDNLRFWPQRWSLAVRRRNLTTALPPAMKSGNYLNSVLALAEAQAQGSDDALMLDYRGYATEGTTSNFFVVSGGEVWTAPLSVGVLAGVTRGLVLETCEQLRIPLRERLMTRYDVLEADEMFLSSSTREIQPIVSLDSRLVGDGQPGPITHQVAVGVRERIGRWCAEHAQESLWTRQSAE